MSDAWWDGRMACLDLETTSPEPTEARIVSIALAFVGAGKPTETWTTVVDPGVEVRDEAAAIHGITTERARAQGADRTMALAQMTAGLDYARYRRLPVVIFNAPFDLTVADREMRRLKGAHDAAVAGRLERGYVAKGADLLAELLVVDPLELDHHLHRYRRGSRKLVDTCEHYGVVLEGPHDAAFDAVAAGRLAWVLARRGEVIRRARGPAEVAELAELQREWLDVRGDLDALQDFQRRLHAERMEHLEQYFRAGNPRRGVPPQPDRVIAREWPILPLGTPTRELVPRSSPQLEPAPDWAV